MIATLLILTALIISVIFNVLLMKHKKESSQNHSVRTAILSGIQNVSELATVRERFQSVVSFSEGVKIPFLDMNFPGTTRKFMLRYHGNIICSCDLSKAQVSERFDVNRVKITVPHSRITDVYADMNSLEVYDQSAGIFTSVKLDDQNRELSSDLANVKEHAIQNGILKQSDENTRKILTSVASSVGMESEIIFIDNPQIQELTNESNNTLQIESGAEVQNNLQEASVNEISKIV